MNVASELEVASFREKSAWASLACTLAVFIPYFVRIFRLAAAGQLEAESVLGAFISATVLAIVIQVVAHILISTQSREEGKDERDRLIDAKAARAAYAILSTTVVIVVGAVVLGHVNETRIDLWRNPIFVSQLFFLCFVLGETARFLTQAIYYRRGV